jgi:hypothetical protein
MIGWHCAQVDRLGHPEAAWHAEVVEDDAETTSTAWRSEKAAKAWVRRELARRFGIERSRLPWIRSEIGGAVVFRVEWMQDEEFRGWGWEF